MLKILLTTLLVLMSVNSFCLDTSSYRFKMSPQKLSKGVFTNASTGQVLTEFEWVFVKDLSPELRETFSVVTQSFTSPKNVVLLVRSTFTIERPLKFFSDGFYEKMINLSTLSGMKYTSTSIKNQYRAFFSPFPFMNISSDVAVSFPTRENFNRYEVFQPIQSDAFIVHLKSSNFNKELIASDIASIFSENDNNTLQVETLSFALLKATSMRGIFFNIKKKAMIKKLKKQTRVMIQLFSK